MIKAIQKRKTSFFKFIFLLDVLFILASILSLYPESYFYFAGLFFVFLTAVAIYIKSSKIGLLEALVNLALFNLPAWFIIVLVVYANNPSKILKNLGFILLFFSFASVAAFILLLIQRILATRKFQLVFNILVIIFMITVSVILYRSNNVNNKLVQSSLEKLQLIENRFGGEENLKCIESETVKKVKRSVVRVIGGEGEGSGFVVNDEGLILTNFHVIEFEPAPKIMFSDNTFETPVILYADKNADLAILKVEKKLPAINWGNSDNIDQTDEVLTLGFPFGSQIAGDVTVKKGSLSAKRIIKDAGGLEFLQIDATLNPGMSGGPLITVCGEFVGINTLGTSGMGMAISSNSFKNKYLEMKSSNEPLKDIVKVEFKPDESPIEAVKAFYNYIKIRKLDKAFALLGEKFTEGMTYENWVKGYAPNMDTSLIKIEVTPDKKNVVKIKLSTKDLAGDEIIYKYFEGWWEIKEVNGHLLLWWPDIHEVKDPDWLWFYE